MSKDFAAVATGEKYVQQILGSFGFPSEDLAGFPEALVAKASGVKITTTRKTGEKFLVLEFNISGPEVAMKVYESAEHAAAVIQASVDAIDIKAEDFITTSVEDAVATAHEALKGTGYKASEVVVPKIKGESAADLIAALAVAVGATTRAAAQALDNEAEVVAATGASNPEPEAKKLTPAEEALAKLNLG